MVVLHRGHGLLHKGRMVVVVVVIRAKCHTIGAAADAQAAAGRFYDWRWRHSLVAASIH